MATRTNRVRTNTPPPPVPQVVPTVRPLGTAARVQAALDLNPGMSETDANIVALATELVQMKRVHAELLAKVQRLESAMTTLLKLSLEDKPVKAKVEAPVAQVETPRATQQRMNAARVPTKGRQPARVSAKAEPVTFLGNARLIKVFDSFVEQGIHFNKEEHDAKLAKPQAKYLLDAANDYLDAYQGNDTYLLSVMQRDRTARSVPQLRGTLGKMLTYYKAALAR